MSDVSTSIYAFLLEVANSAQQQTVRDACGAATLDEVLALKSQPNGLAALDGSGNLVAPIIIHRTGTTAELAALVLAEGEIAYNTETTFLHKGDGVTLGGSIDTTTLDTLGIITAGGGVQIGTDAVTSDGVAIGLNSEANSGSALGKGARTEDGFAAGAFAIAYGPGRIQIGTGTNYLDNSIQFRNSGSVTDPQFGRLARSTAVTYKIADFDLTTADNIDSVLLNTDYTFLATDVVIHYTTNDTWTVVPATCSVGFANDSDVPGTLAEWSDSFCDSLTEETSSLAIGDAPTNSRVSTGFDSLAVHVDAATPATATALVADVYILGIEI